MRRIAGKADTAGYETNKTIKVQGDFETCPVELVERFLFCLLYPIPTPSL